MQNAEWVFPCGCEPKIVPDLQLQGGGAPPSEGRRKPFSAVTFGGAPSLLLFKTPLLSVIVSSVDDVLHTPEAHGKHGDGKICKFARKRRTPTFCFLRIFGVLLPCLATLSRYLVSIPCLNTLSRYVVSLRPARRGGVAFVRAVNCQSAPSRCLLKWSPRGPPWEVTASLQRGGGRHPSLLNV